MNDTPNAIHPAGVSPPALAATADTNVTPMAISQGEGWRSCGVVPHESVGSDGHGSMESGVPSPSESVVVSIGTIIVDFESANEFGAPTARHANRNKAAGVR